MSTSTLKKHSIERRTAETQTPEKERRPNELVFASASVNLRKVWEATRKEAGISGVRFHDLRHTFATRMADAGIEMQELAKILGHTEIAMTYRYYHLTQKVKDKMRDILNKRAAR